MHTFCSIHYVIQYRLAPFLLQYGLYKYKSEPREVTDVMYGKTQRKIPPS